MGKKAELIAEQQLEIKLLKGLLEAHSDSAGKVHMLIFNVNGPLNGNVLAYKPGQLEPFYRIAEALNLN